MLHSMSLALTIAQGVKLMACKMKTVHRLAARAFDGEAEIVRFRQLAVAPTATDFFHAKLLS
jgi:hypothetical protein